MKTKAVLAFNFHNSVYMAAFSESEKTGLATVKQLIEKDYRNHYSIDYLAGVALMSRSKLIKLFKLYYGMGLFEHLLNFRMALGKKLLEDSSFSIKMIAYKCGYRHPCNFSTAFKGRYGVSPEGYRRM